MNWFKQQIEDFKWGFKTDWETKNLTNLKHKETFSEALVYLIILLLLLSATGILALLRLLLT